MPLRPTRPQIWLAILALLVLALLPSLSRALAAGQGDWVELCTTQGSRWVSLSTGEQGEPEFKPLEPPCHYCQLQQQLDLLPPALTPLWQAPALSAEVPTAFLRAPYPLPIWRAAQPRGPPTRLR